MKQIKYTKNQSFLICFLAYCFALFGAGMTIWFLDGAYSVLWETFWADVVATTIIFASSVALRNASMYDAYWSVAPVPILFYWWYLDGNVDLRAILLAVVVCLWAIRLTANWARGWSGLDHEDWRYGQLRKQTGLFYPFVNYAGIHMFPTVLVFLGCIPLYFLYQKSKSIPFHWIEILWFLLGILSTYIEWSADEQLRRFKQKNKDPKAYIQEGLWRYSRHPNYFGEILLWTSLAIWGWWLEMPLWAIAGAISMWLLMLIVSIPMMEKRMLKKRPHYQDYRNKVSMLVPWFSKL